MSNESRDPFSERFFAWMDSEGLKPQELARKLNKKDQTIFNWRSRGVPKAQRVACEAIMERREAEKAEALGGEDPTFIIRPTYDQFQNWNRAALEAGKLIEDWALDALDSLSVESGSEAGSESLAVAEKKGRYSAKDDE